MNVHLFTKVFNRPKVSLNHTVAEWSQDSAADA